jgi:hypothetical protein
MQPIESIPTLGPGLPESVYELVLASELEHRQAAHDVVSTWFPWYHVVHIEMGFRAGLPSATSQQAFADKLQSGPDQERHHARR